MSNDAICTEKNLLVTHKRLEEGSFRAHEDGVKECEDCFRPAAVKLYVDDADKVRGISRTWFCKDNPVDFSIGLMIFSTTRKKEVDAIRACSTHANYHMHHWHHLKVNETDVNQIYPLDTIDDVMNAHAHASENVLPRYEEWRQEWEKRM